MTKPNPGTKEYMSNTAIDEILNELMEYSFQYGKGKIPMSDNPPLLLARSAKQAITHQLKLAELRGRIDELNGFILFFRNGTKDEKFVCDEMRSRVKEIKAELTKLEQLEKEAHN